MSKATDKYEGETQDILKAIEEAGRKDFEPDIKKPKVSYITKRLSKDNYYLAIASSVSTRSTCIKRQYGAVIVNNDEIIATGYNGNPRGDFNCLDVGKCSRLDKPHNSGDYSDCNSVHAEQNAMISAARRDMIGGTLYLFGSENGRMIKAEPCPICKRMIQNAGIARVVCSN